MKAFISRLASVFIVIALVVIIISALPKIMADFVIREGGLVESLSALAWFIATFIIVFKKRIVLAMLPLFCGMRELDLHKAWTTDSVLKSKYYLGDYVSGEEKLLAATVVLLFFAAIVRVCVLHGRQFYFDFRAGQQYAVDISSSLLLIFVSKIFLDGIERKLKSLQINIDMPFFVEAVEECMELAAASLIVMVCIAWVRKKRG